MRTVRLVFFHGRGLVSWCIRTLTRGEFSHVAVLTEDFTLYESWQGSGKHLWRNSGVRKIPNWKPTGGGGVDTYKVEVTELQYEEITRYLEAQVGKRYDYRGVLCFVTKRKPRDNDTFFCSELAHDAFKSARKFLLNVPCGALVSPVLLSYSPVPKLESYIP